MGSLIVAPMSISRLCSAVMGSRFARRGRGFAARRLGALLAGAVGLFPTARAADSTAPLIEDVKIEWGSLTLYSENDFYFAGTDRRYTNGFKATVLARNVRQFDQPFIWKPVREAARLLGSLVPQHEQPQLAVSLGQNIYTPEDIHTPVPQLQDRPYAGWLYCEAAFQAYRPGAIEVLDTASFELGVVGPWALGRTIQNGWHQMFGLRPAEGWANQIHNEICPNVILERKWRWRHRDGEAAGWNTDFIPHLGGSAGTAFTYLSFGGTVRVGYNLPDDFGSNLIRPTGHATADTRPGFNAHVFAQVDGRVVARDITLDGNTWRGSPSIPKEPLVGDFVVGLSAGLRRWQLTYAQAYRAKEFRGQADAQVFGSVSLAFYY